VDSHIKQMVTEEERLDSEEVKRRISSFEIPFVSLSNGAFKMLFTPSIRMNSFLIIYTLYAQSKYHIEAILRCGMKHLGIRETRTNSKLRHFAIL
jgi:hypothetical protein